MANDSYVNHVARQSGSNFYYSFFSLPPPQREAITAVYAFCREVDDAVDLPALPAGRQADQAGLPTGQAGQPQADNPEQIIARWPSDPSSMGARSSAINALTRWREELNRTYDGKPTLPLTRSLSTAIERFQLTKDYFDGILTGVAMDLQVKRYPTFQALSEYCYHVAGEVGLLCMEIFGYRSERLKNYAMKLGTAFQLTNILRDIRSDAVRGRIYIPLEDLTRFGVSEEDILKGQVSPALLKLMAFETRRTRGFYQEVKVLPLPDERQALRAAEIMRAIYENLLQRVERRPTEVFTRTIRVPKLVKVALALKTYWECRS